MRNILPRCFKKRFLRDSSIPSMVSVLILSTDGFICVLQTRSQLFVSSAKRIPQKISQNINKEFGKQFCEDLSRGVLFGTLQSSRMSEPVIHVEHLKKTFGTVTAVNDVS